MQVCKQLALCLWFLGEKSGTFISNQVRPTRKSNRQTYQ